MKIQRIVLYILAGLCVIQIIRLYVENRYLQHMMQGKKAVKVRRVPGGYSVDASGRYLVHRFYKSEGYGINEINVKDVTMVAHCTVERLHHVIGLSKTWAGPMSISIFAPGNDAAFVDDVIDGLRLCWPSLRQTTSFHMVYPKGERMRANMTGVGRFAYLSCKDVMRRMMLRKRSDNILYPKYDDAILDEDLRYPHNLMRNVALSGALTDFVLSVDVEMIPSLDLRNQFLEFAEREDLFKKARKEKDVEIVERNTVYVLPVFEVRQDEEIGRTKRELLKTVKLNNARPYLQETCIPCHKQTNYDKWMSKSDMEKRFGIGFEVAFGLGWEPFFIAKRDSPWYDEKITKFGHDRLSQICELKSKNYKFMVLNHGFLLRKSYRYKTKMTSSETQRRDQKMNFRDEFKDKMRESGRISKENIRMC